MNYAIIAAGEGSRLKEEGIVEPKPLVRILGEPMIERLIRIFMNNGAQSISVICNEQMREVQIYLERLKDSELLHREDNSICPLNIVIQTTSSSMHSLAALKPVIPDGLFCLTTVDTLFRESDFSDFIRANTSLLESKSDGLFAVTPFVDDEKPLWVGLKNLNFFSCACDGRVSGKKRIVGFYDNRQQMPADAEISVSGGIYCLDTRTAFPVLEECLNRNQSRMRNFQRALVDTGLTLDAYVFPKIMDVDHAADIEKAETWLTEDSHRILAISRDRIYSPNSEKKDAAIWNAVLERLRVRGWCVEETSEEEFISMNEKECMKRYSKIVHMTRHMRSLMRIEKMNLPAFNKAHAVRVVAKSREMTLQRLQQNGVPIPAWWAFDPEEDEMFVCEQHLQRLLPGWVKAMREDGARPQDVSFVKTPLEADSLILQLSAQRVPDIIVMQHVDGELIKCYAVLDENSDDEIRLLRWFRPQETGYSKFGEAESHNTPPSTRAIDEKKLMLLAKTIGRTLDLQIFGFDAIIKSDDSINIIDVNDWPSFSCCREEAADAITKVILQE